MAPHSTVCILRTDDSTRHYWVMKLVSVACRPLHQNTARSKRNSFQKKHHCNIFLETSAWLQMKRRKKKKKKKTSLLPFFWVIVLNVVVFKSQTRVEASNAHCSVSSVNEDKSRQVAGEMWKLLYVNFWKLKGHSAVRGTVCRRGANVYYTLQCAFHFTHKCTCPPMSACSGRSLGAIATHKSV